jgi:TM2 domain-containing membrane protein YozV
MSCNCFAGIEQFLSAHGLAGMLYLACLLLFQPVLLLLRKHATAFVLYSEANSFLLLQTNALCAVIL